MKELQYLIVEDVLDKNYFGVNTQRTKITLGKKGEDGSLICENSIWTSENLKMLTAIALLVDLYDFK